MLLIFSLHFYSRDSSAVIQTLPANILPEVLSETVPSAFAPGPLNTEDFELQWTGDPIPGVTVQLSRDTAQWVRVMDLFRVARARLVVDCDSVDAGTISNMGFTQPLVVQTSHGHAEIPIALLSGEHNPIQLAIRKSGTVIRRELQLVFKPRAHLASLEGRFYIDSSCSPFGVTVNAAAESAQETTSHWGYVTCRLVRVNQTSHQTSSFEILLLWDGVGQSIRIGGIDTASSSVSIWPLRLASAPGSVLVQSKKQDLVIQYRVPEHFHNARVGLGIGPYNYRFNGNGENSNSFVPIPTLYGSYSITESYQIVGFGVVTPETHTYSDFGLYLRLEEFRFLDRRFGIYLLVGGHFIAFQSLGQLYVSSAFPQGIEITFTDFLGRGMTLSTGGFVYPLISGESYYNVWIRWGGKIFAEFNYIALETQPGSVGFSSYSTGLSIGFPLFQFF